MPIICVQNVNTVTLIQRRFSSIQDEAAVICRISFALYVVIHWERMDLIFLLRPSLDLREIRSRILI